MKSYEFHIDPTHIPNWVFILSEANFTCNIYIFLNKGVVSSNEEDELLYIALIANVTFTYKEYFSKNLQLLNICVKVFLYKNPPTMHLSREQNLGWWSKWNKLTFIKRLKWVPWKIYLYTIQATTRLKTHRSLSTVLLPYCFKQHFFKVKVTQS